MMIWMPVVTTLSLLLCVSAPCDGAAIASAESLACSESDSVIGKWDMRTDFNGQPIFAIMTIVRDMEGGLMGAWTCIGHEHELIDVVYKEQRLTFECEMPEGHLLTFVGYVDADRIDGEWHSEIGVHPCEGNRRAG